VKRLSILESSLPTSASSPVGSYRLRLLSFEILFGKFDILLLFSRWQL